VARRFAASHRCVLILKGARTVVAEPSSHAWINPTGNPGMASGGMGDVLCGVVGGLVAQGLTAAEAARLGVYLHGASADRAAMEGGEIGLVASDVIAGLRPGLCDLQRHLGV
jgi:NAD(P)H-hydrate epimerase